MVDRDIIVNDNIKVYSIDDEILRLVGTILSTRKSRLIYSLLIENEYHAREIAMKIEDSTNPHLPGVKFHLNKMVKSGLVKVRIKLQRKHGKHLKYYKATPFILITPSSFQILTNKIIELHII